MTDKIFQIQIALKGFKPKIWRRLLIPSDVLLSDFHKIIQTTMGWTNSHLHQFIKNRTFYSVKDTDDDMWSDTDYVDYKKKEIRISDLLKKKKTESFMNTISAMDGSMTSYLKRFFRLILKKISHLPDR
jgi:hypothetical protein